jgi:AbrB family looped-hinge helix DNA binding protein
MKITANGQVTIPKRLRDEFGFQPNTCVTFIREGQSLRIVHAGRGKALADRMRGKGRLRMPTDKLMKILRGDGALCHHTGNYNGARLRDVVRIRRTT